MIHQGSGRALVEAGRDMGPSPATVCPIMWVNQAQAWDDGYCTRPVLRMSGTEEEILRVHRPGHAEKLLKGVIVPGIYIPHKGTSQRKEALSLGDTGNEVIVVAGRKLFPEQVREETTQPFRLLGVGEKEVEGETYVVQSDIIVPVQSRDGALRRLLGFIWPRLARGPFLVCLLLPGIDLSSYRIRDALLWCRTFVKAAHGMNLIINVLIQRHGHRCTRQAAGSLSGMSMRWSMTGSCAAPCKARLQCLPWTTRT